MPRRNPRTKLTKLAFRNQDRLLQREMARAEKRYNFEAAALALSEWTGRGHEEMRAHGLRVIVEGVRKLENAIKAVERLIKLNRRLGVWCACAAARETSQYIPKDEWRQLRAIETAEDWVRGLATKEQVKKAAEDAYAAAGAAYATAYVSASTSTKLTPVIHSSEYAAAYAANAAYETDATWVLEYAEKAVDYAAFGLEHARNITRDIALRFLVEVIAEAIMTFPRKTSVRTNPTKYQKTTTSFIKKLPPELNRRDIVAIMQYLREMDIEYSEVEAGPQRLLYLIPWLATLVSKNDRGTLEILSRKASDLCDSIGWKDQDGYDIEGYPSSAAVALSLAVNGSPYAQVWLKKNFPSLAEAIAGHP